MAKEKNNNGLIFVLVTLLIVAGGLIYKSYYFNDNPYKDKYKELQADYNALSKSIAIKEDSLKKVSQEMQQKELIIDSLLMEVHQVKIELKLYEKDFNSIINLPLDSSVNLLSRNLSKGNKY